MSAGVNRDVMRALAASLSVEELEARRDAAIAALEEQAEVITAATTGGGASYQREVLLRAEDRVALYDGALRLKLGETDGMDDVSQVARPWFA